MHRIAGRRDEIEMFVEGSRLLILGMDGKSAQARDFGGGERAAERILEQAGADPLA